MQGVEHADIRLTGNIGALKKLTHLWGIREECIAQFADEFAQNVAAGQPHTLTLQQIGCQTEAAADDIAGGCRDVNAPSNDVSVDYLSANAQPALAALRERMSLALLVSSQAAPADACTPANVAGWIAASSAPITACTG